MAAIAIYVLDHIIRIVKTRVTTAKISTVTELGFTKVVIPSIGSGWRAGQHIRIRVLSLELGLFDWLVAHPFTIASAPSAQALFRRPRSSRLLLPSMHLMYTLDETGNRVYTLKVC